MKNIGKMIYGFCNGYFGRDDYDTKIIVYETPKAICCTYVDSQYNGILTTANFKNEKEKQECIDAWCNNNDEYY